MTPRTLARRRALMRASLWAERLVPALAPACALLAAVACAVLLGAAEPLGYGPHLALLLVTLAAAAALLYRGLRRAGTPTSWEVDRRLEAGGGVAHQPLLALADTPSGGDGALWSLHAARQATAAARVRPTWPRAGMAARDPRALRAGLAIALVASLVVAGPDGPSRLSHALRPVRPASPPAPAATVQAWLTPPAFTGQPPAVLADAADPVPVLSGTTLTVAATGIAGAAAPTLEGVGEPVPLAALNPGSFQTVVTLTEPGRLRVRHRGGTLATWTFAVSPAAAPEIAWSAPPGPEPRDETETPPSLRLPWEVRDPYGVTALRAELRLADRPDLPGLTLPLTLPAALPRAAHGVGTQDLSAHPFAGLAVVAALTADNAVPLTGRSEDARFVLPERSFHTQAARTLIAARKMLTLRPEDHRGPAEEIFALAQSPDRPRDTASALELGAIGGLLIGDKSADAVALAQGRLWSLALRLEDAPNRTADALDAARRDAKQALESAEKDPSSETREALDKKLTEMRAALDDHIQALDQQNADAGQQSDPDQRATERDAERDADAARDTARQNQLPKTGDKLSALDRDLAKLHDQQAARDPAAAEQKQKEAGRRRGRQQLNVVQDMVQHETGLVDQADRRARVPSRTGPDAQTPPAERLSRDATERASDSRTQQALRRALGELLQQSGDLTGAVPKGLTDADRSMRDAAGALDHGFDQPARAEGQRAIASLQEGARELADALRQKFGNKSGEQKGDQAGKGGDPGDDADGEGGPGEGDEDMALDGSGQDGEQDGSQPGGKSGAGTGRGEKRDPFGRALTEGGRGLDDGGNVRVPTEMDRQRARDLRGELRRRDADQTRPAGERAYIERLLEGTE